RVDSRDVPARDSWRLNTTTHRRLRCTLVTGNCTGSGPSGRPTPIAARASPSRGVDPDSAPGTRTGTSCDAGGLDLARGAMAAGLPRGAGPVRPAAFPP